MLFSQQVKNSLSQSLPLFPAPSQRGTRPCLAGKKVTAAGRISGNGFTVCKGSGFCPAETKSCHKYIKAMRMRLIAEGKVKDNVFVDDVYFNSTSTAAACIIGGSANGNILWINPDGKTIKELKQQDIK